VKAAAISAVLLFSSIAYVRRRFYEIFQKLYLILAAVLIAAIYLHSASKDL
jgi:ABC-type multidrug transport system permease subunit